MGASEPRGLGTFGLETSRPSPADVRRMCAHGDVQPVVRPALAGGSVKLLTFLARSFAWQPHAPSLGQPGEVSASSPSELGELSASSSSASQPPPAPSSGAVSDAVVVFVHAQKLDETSEARDRALRQSVKHIQWLAGKRDLGRVVLHSFTHLGGENSDPEFARAFLEELGARLSKKGFAVAMTPFGFTCAWQLDAYGESLAKVWKEI